MVPQLRSSSDVRTDDATHIPREYENLSYIMRLWGRGGISFQGCSENNSRQQGKETGVGF